MASRKKRAPGETRAAAERVALALFTAKGYEATSLREIAELLGVTKAALYYHFASKDEIVASIVATRAAEVAELLRWARAEHAGPGLAEKVVLRSVESTTVDKLRGIRFMLANPTAMRAMGDGARGIKDGLDALSRLVAGAGADARRLLIMRMALLSINAAAMAANGTKATDEEVVAAAKEVAKGLVDLLGPSAAAGPNQPGVPPNQPGVPRRRRKT